MTLKQFFLNMVSTAESSINSKIIAGFISLFSTIVFGHLKFMEPMLVMAGLTAAFFGLSTLDFRSILKGPTDPPKSNI